MAGYSGRSVVQKLGIKPGFRIFVDSAPASYDEIVGELPADATIASRLKAKFDMVHLFAMQAAALRKKLPACREAIAPDGMVWVSWPKKSSGVATDATENVVCAIDDTWSGLKLVIPRDQRKPTAPAKREKPAGK
jgi:hypothetical protein